jgi:hypothetical protein
MLFEKKNRSNIWLLLKRQQKFYFTKGRKFLDHSNSNQFPNKDFVESSLFLLRNHRNPHVLDHANNIMTLHFMHFNLSSLFNFLSWVQIFSSALCSEILSIQVLALRFHTKVTLQYNTYLKSRIITEFSITEFIEFLLTKDQIGHNLAFKNGN